MSPVALCGVGLCFKRLGLPHIVPKQPKCLTLLSATKLDYFCIDDQLSSIVENIRVDIAAATSPHLPVELRLVRAPTMVWFLI